VKVVCALGKSYGLREGLVGLQGLLKVCEGKVWECRFSAYLGCGTLVSGRSVGWVKYWEECCRRFGLLGKSYSVWSVAIF
jgi:hypothetical protein